MKMPLTAEEGAWLAAYREELTRRFPGLVQQIIIFGSKATGKSTPESDLDLLLVIREGDWRVKDAVTEPGYLLAANTEVVPSILVYTQQEWDQSRRDDAPFWQTVNRDGVSVG